MPRYPSLTLAGKGIAFRLNPVTKLTLVGCALLLAFLIPGWWPPWVLFTALAGFAQINRLLILLGKKLLKIILPLVFFLFFIHGLFYHQMSAPLTLAGVDFSREGLLFALQMTGRISAALAASLLFVLTTPTADLMLALSQRGTPAAITYIIGATLQLIPQLQARAAAIGDAQRARGMETDGSLLRRIRALLPLVLPLVLGSLVDVEERAIALEARAFRVKGPKSSLHELPDPQSERLLCRLALILTLATIVVVWWG
jgi:energy-coupling factor transport system permease protein